MFFKQDILRKISELRIIILGKISTKSGVKGWQKRVPMVLNPNGIEPTFLKLDSWSPGAGFIPIITSNALNKIKETRIQEENKSVLCIKKTVFKKGFNTVLVQFHAYQKKRYTYIIYVYISLFCKNLLIPLCCQWKRKA